jgi:phosphate transport system protein
MTHLETDLRDLRRELGLLLNRARNAIALSGEALLEGSHKKAERVIHGDLEIDAKQRELEAHCLVLISRHQLLARDARLVTGVLGSLGDLERAGDYAAHIAEEVGQVRLEGVFEALHDLFRELREMAECLSTALTRDDAVLARAVRDADARVDTLVNAANERVIAGFDAHRVAQTLSTLRVLRSGQRIGDHLENVAERLEFWVTGLRG